MQPLLDFFSANSLLLALLGINALLGLSIYVTLASGQLTLGNAGFMSIGAYTAAILTKVSHAPFALALLAGVALAVVVSLVLGASVLRLRGVYLAIATIGFGEMVRVAALNLSITGGPTGLNNIPQLTRGWHILLALALLVYFFYRLRGSQIGYAFEALREDEVAAQVAGIATFNYKLLAFALGAAIAALAGALDAHLNFFIIPTEYGFSRAVSILTFAVVGGFSSFWGGILGAGLITLLPQVLDGLATLSGGAGPLVWLKGHPDVFSGLMLLLVILFLPGGLVSLGVLLWRRFRRKGNASEPPLPTSTGNASEPLLLTGQGNASEPPLPTSQGNASEPPLPTSQGNASELPLLTSTDSASEPPLLTSKGNAPESSLLTSTDSAPLTTPGEQEEIENISTAQQGEVKAPPLLIVRGLSRSFGGVRAVDNVSFTVQPGEVYGLIGPNGAGKTTIFNILSGILSPSAGEVIFKGQRIDRLPSQRITRTGVTRTFQNIRLFRTLTALENVLIGEHPTYQENFLVRLLALPAGRRARRERLRRAGALLALVGLAGREKVVAANLAYGDQRRLEIARALASNPTLLLLDEPAAGMNETETAQLRRLLQTLLERGLTILLIEHDMKLVMSVCNRLSVLNFGKLLAENTPQTVSRDPLVIEAYLGSGDD